MKTDRYLNKIENSIQLQTYYVSESDIDRGFCNSDSYNVNGNNINTLRN